MKKFFATQVARPMRIESREIVMTTRATSLVTSRAALMTKIARDTLVNRCVGLVR